MKEWLVPVIITVSILLIILSLISYGIYWAFFDIQRLDGQEVITISNSPDSSYTVTAYLNNGGATTDYAVLCAVKNNKTGKEEVFTILGPWESDPDNNIYSYVSPLGMQCLNRRVDETFVISVNDTDSTEYTVLSIEKADF